ncbi:MAG: nicotinate phosphoribosyltransferase [Caldisphaeraceae archaeon]|nr:nicotinate phosphoribosyltransferase [Caldisphaeraceae archaeon]
MKGVPRIYLASIDEILNGEATDIYFLRTKNVIDAAGLSNVKVRMEVHLYSNIPGGTEWAVYAGLEEALALLKDKPVTVYSIPEGTLFTRKMPLMIVEGRYSDFATFEAPLLGLLRFSSSIATKAATLKHIIGNKTLLFFGIRSLHPAVYPAADRAAFIGGADSISGALSEKYLGIKPQGTMPHALILVFGNQKEAWEWFEKIYGKETKFIALVDTLDDEKVEALMAAHTFGKKLWGIRLDTPSSRRGSMRDIVEEIKWTLDINGFKDVKIIVSGGLDENAILSLRDIVDGFGVGTSIAMAPSIDLSMDIVEINRGNGWIPFTKRGKLAGAKKVYSCRPLEYYIKYWNSKELPVCKNEEDKPIDLMKKYIENGRLIEDLPNVEEIRGYVLSQLRYIDTK